VNSGSGLLLSDGITIGSTKQLGINGTGVNGTGVLVNASGVNSWAGSILLNGASTIEMDADSLTMSGGINTNGQVLTVGSNTGSGHGLISGVISGGGGLTKVGVNRLTLSGANTYTGSTYITSGGLIMGANDVLPNSSVVYFNGGMLDNGGYTDQLGQLNIPVSSTLSLRGTGVITFGSVGLLLDYKRLTILGWQGNYGETSAAGPSSATGSRVKFASMLSSYQLDQLWFNDGTNNYYALELSDGTYEIVPGQDVLLYPRSHSNIIINAGGATTGVWGGTGTLLDPLSLIHI
jgi:autotransporter-associated beta strand protein